MDWTFIICAIGFIFCGFIIGYPFGHAMCSRSIQPKSESLPMPSVVCASRQRIESYGVLAASILEEKQ
jgi:hypothetical protein